jgi:site-specific DNA-methyltransferase (adenine-specific)
MIELDQVTQMDCLKAMTDLSDQAVDVTLTDPPYVNRMRLFSESIVDGYAGLYLACKKTKNYVVFFWSNENIPQAPPGWYEVARHIWHKPDCKSITHYELIIVWSRDYKRKTSRVWSIPILDYRSLRDWKPHPTQKPVRLIRYLLEQYTKEGDTVLDPFVGTGTTAVACKQMHRHFIAIDNDPAYVKMATHRLTSRDKQDEPAARAATTTAKETPAEDHDACSDDEITEHAAQDDPIQDESAEESLQDTGEEPQAPPARRAPRTAHLGAARTQRPTQRAEEKPRRPPKPTSRATPARRHTLAKR